MGEAFPFLADMHVTAVETVEPYEATANPEAHGALLANSGQAQSLARPSRADFKDVLIALDVPAGEATEEGPTAFDLTGGHLALATRCAKRMQEEGPGFLAAISDSDGFARELLTDRVRLLGSVGSSALAMLQIAAVLGMRFRRKELICAFGGDASTASKLLRDCRDEDVIELFEIFADSSTACTGSTFVNRVSSMRRVSTRPSPTAFDSCGPATTYCDAGTPVRPNAIVRRQRSLSRRLCSASGTGSHGGIFPRMFWLRSRRPR